MVCPKCSSSTHEIFKFCPFCGVALQGGFTESQLSSHESLPIPSPDFNDPGVEADDRSTLLIEFGESSSPNFPAILATSINLAGFHDTGRSTNYRYRLEFPHERLAVYLPLAEALKPFKNKAISINGERVKWTEFFEFSRCFQQKQSSFKPELYCFGFEQTYAFNIWGCIQAHLPFNGRHDWFCWGKWGVKHGDWIFDKPRILHELKRSLFRFRFCPAMNASLIDEIIVAFPDSVNPIEDNDWKFVESWDDDFRTELLEVSMMRYGEIAKVKVKGVCPAGDGALRKISAKLKNRLPSSFGESFSSPMPPDAEPQCRDEVIEIKNKPSWMSRLLKLGQ